MPTLKLTAVQCADVLRFMAREHEALPFRLAAALVPGRRDRKRLGVERPAAGVAL